MASLHQISALGDGLLGFGQMRALGGVSAFEGSRERAQCGFKRAMAQRDRCARARSRSAPARLRGGREPGGRVAGRIG